MHLPARAFASRPWKGQLAYNKKCDNSSRPSFGIQSATFPGDTVLSWLLLLRLARWSECRCTCRNGRSCRFSRFSHCRKLECLEMSFDNQSHPFGFQFRYEFVLSRDSPSSIGFASKICCSIHECFPLIAARYCRINFVLSVFPAPLSPLKWTRISINDTKKKIRASRNYIQIVFN